MTINYASEKLNDMVKFDNKSDLIFIDGRYRVLCRLFIAKNFGSDDKFTIIIDDDVNRNYYSIIKNFFNIKLIVRFAVSNSLKDFDRNKIDELIKKYSLNYR